MNFQHVSHLLHRTALVLAALLLLALAASAAKAQPAPEEPAGPHDVVLLVRTPRHLDAALKTAAELQTGDAFETGRIEVIVCGEASAALQAGSDRAPALREAAARGVTITACGMSLASAGIDPSALADVVRVVPNGLVRALQLQAEGYLSVEL